MKQSMFQREDSTKFFKEAKSRVLNFVKDPTFGRKVMHIGSNIFVLSLLFVSNAYASDTTVTSHGVVIHDDFWINVENFVDDFYGKMVAIDTTAAGLGAAFGGFLIKTSGGKEQKIELGKKCMWGSGISWAVLNSLGGILGYADNFFGAGQATGTVDGIIRYACHFFGVAA